MADDGAQARFPRRTARRLNTQARILDAAEQLFRRVGYGAATMNAIADAADIHVTTLFTHFRSKQDLAAALNTRALETLQALVADARARRVPFFAFFRAVALGTAATLEGEAEPALSLWHELRRDAALALVWADYERHLVALLAAYVAADAGRDPDDDAVMLATHTMVMATWLAHRRWSEDSAGRNLAAETTAALDIAEAMARASLAFPMPT